MLKLLTARFRMGIACQADAHLLCNLKFVTLLPHAQFYRKSFPLICDTTILTQYCDWSRESGVQQLQLN